MATVSTNDTPEKICFSSLEVAHRNRVFRSLYIADRVLGSILERPYAITNRDWDEPPLIRARKVKAMLRSELLQLELVRLMIVISQTVDNKYLRASIDLHCTRLLECKSIDNYLEHLTQNHVVDCERLTKFVFH